MEDKSMLTRGAVMVQGHVLLALIGTHPDLVRLQEELARISEGHMGNVLAAPQSDESIAVYQAGLAQRQHWISLAMDRANRKSAIHAIPDA
jgi:hypothetical protein